MPLEAEPWDESSGHCDCCGTTSRTIWGGLSYDDAAVAVYYVTWTVGRPDHGADFDLLIGRWGEGSAPEQRFLVSLRFRTAPDGGFMVIDGEAGKYTMCSRALARGEVVGTPLAQEVFDLVDAIWLQDQRLEEIRAAGS